MNIIKKWLCRDELAEIHILKGDVNNLRHDSGILIKDIRLRNQQLEDANKELLDTRLENQKLRGELEGARSELAKAKVNGGKRKNLRARAK